MNRAWRRRTGMTLAALALAANYTPWACALRALPDTLTLSCGQTSVVQTGPLMRATAREGAVQVASLSGERLCDVQVSAVGGGEDSVTFSLLGLIPLHETRVNVNGARTLIPGGQAVGVALKTQGVLVVSKTAHSSAKSPLRAGDVILSVEGEAVASAASLSERLNALDSDTASLCVLRAGRRMTLQAQTPADASDGRRRLGVWVRDSTAGVGTLSYVDPQSGVYGALGHAIVDADTGETLTVQDGALMRATVVGITRGGSGRAGELRGSFLKEGEQIGTLMVNGAYGIYGRMEGAPEGLLYPQGLPVGSRSAVHPGAASILSTVDGQGPQEYSIEIVRCFSQDAPSQKGMILRVTDERLLEKTGGIVQGMSGSPILQDGRIIGAVTHVYLNDSTQGYGMYIEWMLEQSDRIGGHNDQANAA